MVATIKELKDQLVKLEEEVREKKQRKQSLQTEIDTIAGEIEAILGHTVAAKGKRAVRNPNGKKKVTAKATNELSLKKHIEKALRGHKRGLTISELETAVRTNGYKTNSKNFRNVVYQCLYQQKIAQHDEKTSKYKLAK